MKYKHREPNNISRTYMIKNYMRRVIVAVALWAMLVATAQLYAVTPTGSGNAPEKEFVSFTLPNGLEVVVVENHLVPIVTIEMAVRNGSFTEGPEYAGLSHLYEHMFFKGNSTYKTSQAFFGALSALGAISNATTREEVVYYYYTLPMENLEPGMEVMANTMQTPLFDKEELEREREVVLGEFDRHEANPFFEYNRAMDFAMWGDYVTRKQPIGQRNIIKTAPPEKMRYIQKKYYIPNNSLLIIAGDVDSAQVHKLAERYFSSWKRGPDPFESDPPPFPKPLEEKKMVAVPAALDIAQIEYQWHGPSSTLDEKATYAADVMIFILSQPQSRFQRQLVESGLAQGAGISYYTQKYTGPINVQVVTTPDKLRKVIDATWEEIEAFDSPDYFTDEELETAKARLHVDHLFNSEETNEWTHTLGFWWSTTGLDYFRGYLDNLSKVTREDIQEYVRKYIKGKNYVFGVSTNEEALRQLNLKPAEALR